MRIKSALFTEASGSVGGFFVQGSRAGMVLHPRSRKPNRNTARQSAQRSVMTAARAAWSSQLLPEGRQKWDSLAESPNTGFGLFMRAFSFAQTTGIAFDPAGPTATQLPPRPNNLFGITLDPPLLVIRFEYPQMDSAYYGIASISAPLPGTSRRMNQPAIAKAATAGIVGASDMLVAITQTEIEPPTAPFVPGSRVLVGLTLQTAEGLPSSTLRAIGEVIEI